MRLLAFALTAPLALALTACGEPDEGTDAFMTLPGDTSSEAGSSDTMVPQDMANDSGTSDSTTASDTTDTGTTDTTDSTGTDTSTSTGSTSTTGSANCGNGTIESGEQCDGSNLNGFGCSDLGFSGGTLACDPVTCTFDTSACTTNPGSTGY